MSHFGLRRDVFLKIEPVLGYSPLAPEPALGP